ncbi:hypothetical protein LOTGIDRAFT_129677 [Lottia gigantea]|uniref:ASPIC/UnbV domain-containing protein n=1 Tax=Lottia gigantea TaxID=225164 RepID=V3ZYU4_LOTGI|nr:hypothetical protein LOTGIDRAFT_129677 [Lottia gigantea]ESO86161.1 hypothetical protein LOTGIDRAFT_129677 [Lottia gigantea]
MFRDKTAELIPLDITDETNGVAVTDIDNDGHFEWILAGYTGPNLILKLVNGTYRNVAEVGSPYENLRDPDGAARGVCACDLNGDGREEIYFVNSNHRYSGIESYTDRLFIWRDEKYIDLFQDPINKHIPMYPGTAVACLDRDGDGRYGFFVTTYSEVGRGRHRVIEMDSDHPDHDSGRGHIKLIDVALSTGLGTMNGGQGVAIGPIFGDSSKLDIFITNEGSTRLGNIGKNNLYQYLPNGTYLDVATPEGKLRDTTEDGRGISLGDINNDGLIDVVYGNWFGPHRILLQKTDSVGRSTFENFASQEFSRSSPVTSVLVEDFDNDGGVEILLTNQYNVPGYSHEGMLISSNRLFTTRPNHHGNISLVSLDMGDAIETMLSGSGKISVGDIDEDGVLELVICHNSKHSLPHSVRLYHVIQGRNNNWLRVIPFTQYGAPARGAKVTLTLSDLSKITKIIDLGSGFMSQMEPVAHFGLSANLVEFVKVTWPDGRRIRRSLTDADVNMTLFITYNGVMTSKSTHRRLAEITIEVNGGYIILFPSYSA